MNQCAQCKANYKPCKSASGCPKCAPNVKIAESEFIKPINYRREYEKYIAEAIREGRKFSLCK